MSARHVNCAFCGKTFWAEKYQDAIKATMDHERAEHVRG